MGAPKRCAIFSARACEPVPANILTEGFMGGLNVLQSYHYEIHFVNNRGSTFQQGINIGKNSIFFLVFIPLWQRVIISKLAKNDKSTNH